ncbi:MAG: TrkA family potassium uptake protein [Chloroflexi bacterium]|nr:TrkA family potassium uptake protein [Chloroflexota bacterium]
MSAKKVMVVGLGQFGGAAFQELSALGFDVLGIDLSPDRVQELSSAEVSVVQGDATSQAFWDDLRIEDFDAAVVAFSRDMGANVLASLMLKKIGLPHLVVKSNGPLHSEILYSIGADVVVAPDWEYGARLAHIMGSKVGDYMPVAKEFGLAKTVIGQTARQRLCAEIEKAADVTVLLILREGKVIVAPYGNEAVKPGDTVVIAGTDQKLRAFA